MKKLMLFIAVFSFAAATATFAQTADQKVAQQDKEKAVIAKESSSTPPKACCKSGSSKACCKTNASGTAATKACSNAHADLVQDKKKAVIEAEQIQSSVTAVDAAIQATPQAEAAPAEVPQK